MKNKRRLLVVLESRATYGYSKNVMLMMKNFPNLELKTLVTGMHLIPELGNSIDLIRKDNFPVSYTVEMSAKDTDKSSWATALGSAISGYAKAYKQLQPDIILLSGDRIETFGCCIAAAYMGIPIAHIQAGDKSGHIDDAARHAIGKLAHIHFASCEDSANRLRRMGEQEFRIKNVGAPQLDDIIEGNYKAKNVTINGVTFDLDRSYILLVQHTVLSEINDVSQQITSSLTACQASQLPIYWVYPNSDMGYEKILSVIAEKENSDNITSLTNIERSTYLTLLANCAVLVGNSSSGILEAPSFKVPVVNIGDRQRGRMQANNIINSSYRQEDIITKIEKALNDQEFKSKCANAVNPYGDGKSSERICSILSDISIDKNLLDKQLTY